MDYAGGKSLGVKAGGDYFRLPGPSRLIVLQVYKLDVINKGRNAFIRIYMPLPGSIHTCIFCCFYGRIAIRLTPRRGHMEVFCIHVKSFVQTTCLVFS